MSTAQYKVTMAYRSKNLGLLITTALFEARPLAIALCDRIWASHSEDTDIALSRGGKLLAVWGSRTVFVPSP